MKRVKLEGTLTEGDLDLVAELAHESHGKLENMYHPQHGWLMIAGRITEAGKKFTNELHKAWKKDPLVVSEEFPPMNVWEDRSVKEPGK